MNFPLTIHDEPELVRLIDQVIDRALERQKENLSDEMNQQELKHELGSRYQVELAVKNGLPYVVRGRQKFFKRSAVLEYKSKNHFL